MENCGGWLKRTEEVFSDKGKKECEIMLLSIEEQRRGQYENKDFCLRNAIIQDKCSFDENMANKLRDHRD